MKKRAFSALVALGVVAVAPGCGSEPPPKAPAQSRDVTPSWPDVFDGVPDLYAVVRPRALKKDGVYGAFWRSLMRVAEARGFTRGATMVEAVEGADEIIVGLAKGDDAALVLRGVPASLDPMQMNDAEGQPIFRALTDRGRVAEYELVDHKRAEGVGSLFVLPDRTWVGALGHARGRARQAFSSPMRRPVPKVEADALAVIRVSGPLTSLLARHPTYGALTRKLSNATMSLRPGKVGLVLALEYAEADAAARGEMEAKQIALELAKDEKRYGWLKDAKVAYEGSTVYVRVAIPPRLLEELPNASGADIGL